MLESGVFLQRRSSPSLTPLRMFRSRALLLLKLISKLPLKVAICILVDVRHMHTTIHIPVFFDINLAVLLRRI
jgi:hypothetical protein